jgi:glutamyl/glutaminyl-tRNA synthetase
MIAALPGADTATRQKLSPIVRERISVLGDIEKLAKEGEFDCFIATPTLSDATLLLNKNATPEKTKVHLQKVSELLTSADFTSPETVKTALWVYATQEGRGDVLWPLRVALSGKKQSPDPFVIASMVGKEEVQKRISSAVNLLG